MEFIEYADAELMMMDLANRLAGELRQALTGGGRASLAVPGGTTPGPVFDSLSGAELDWARIDVMPTDERWVPETSERSNARLIRARLMMGKAAAARLIPLYAPAERPEDRLDELTAGVVAALPLSVVLLGMGADMHVASIFPGAVGAQAALHGDAVLVAVRAPGVPEPRVTLSARVLRDAMQRHVVIIGAAKRRALEAARQMTLEEAPVAALLRGAVVHWAEA
jgi:6-phosphogluconolactonase